MTMTIMGTTGINGNQGIFRICSMTDIFMIRYPFRMTSIVGTVRLPASKSTQIGINAGPMIVSLLVGKIVNKTNLLGKVFAVNWGDP